MILSTLITTAVAGASRIGVSMVLPAIINYFKNKQEIKLAEIKSGNVNSTNCDFVCKYQPEKKPDTSTEKSINRHSLENKEPKKFNLLIFIIVLSCFAIAYDIYVSTSYLADIDTLAGKIEELSSFGYYMINYIIVWLLTGREIQRYYKKK